MSVNLNQIKEITSASTDANNTPETGLIAGLFGAVIDTAKLGIYMTTEVVHITRDTIEIIPTVVEETKALGAATLITTQAVINSCTVTEQMEINAYLKTLTSAQRKEVSIYNKLQLIQSAKEWLATV